ncbi:MAG: hypothetical protein AAF126_10505 [Chloroflexota bacterium]
MAIRKDKIIVVDLEATCWEGFDAPEGQENEIILSLRIAISAYSSDCLRLLNYLTTAYEML